MSPAPIYLPRRVSPFERMIPLIYQIAAQKRRQKFLGKQADEKRTERKRELADVRTDKVEDLKRSGYKFWSDPESGETGWTPPKPQLMEIGGRKGYMQGNKWTEFKQKEGPYKIGKEREIKRGDFLVRQKYTNEGWKDIPKQEKTRRYKQEVNIYNDPNAIKKKKDAELKASIKTPTFRQRAKESARKNDPDWDIREPERQRVSERKELDIRIRNAYGNEEVRYGMGKQGKGWYDSNLNLILRDK